MLPLQRHLKKGGYHAIALGYPSVTKSLDEIERELLRKVNELVGDAEVSFVTHSLGGIIARRLLLNQGFRPRPRRVVMIAPPLQGSAAARYFVQRWPRYLPHVAALRDLASMPSDSTLPIPPDQLGIIAGVGPGGGGYGPWLGGANDGLVTFDETYAPGAQRHKIEAFHTVLPLHPATFSAARTFLTHGRF